MTIATTIVLSLTASSRAQSGYTYLPAGAPLPPGYQYVSQPTTVASPAQGYAPTYAQQPTAPATTYTYASNYAAPAAVAQPGVTYAAPATTADYGGDPTGFINWLNGVRAQYGLGAVAYDPGLAGEAAVNSQIQNSRGIGHFSMGSARRQNSAMGSIGSIGAMWLNSPAHRAALLDPSVRWMGLAGVGAYWTLNLR
jgi:uncharacterized protein YkwD